MDEVIAGRFDCENVGRQQADPDSFALEFSSDEIVFSLKKDEIAEGSFTIYANAKVPAEGYVYSSELNMQCLVEEFIGVKEVIAYRFDAEGMEEGQVWEGSFVIISNYGEYEIPYRVTVETEEIISSMGPIRNMFHFANLAKVNWDEAVKIFYSKSFGKLFKEGTDRQYAAAYKGLSAVYGNEQNMEEFLLEINKKQRVAYSLEQTQIQLDDPFGVAEYGLNVVRNGWGYTFFKIEAEGDFLRTEKEAATDNEFLGNSFRLIYYIDSEKLHAGRNYGSIRIYNAYMEQRIPVTVMCSTKRQRAFGLAREKKRILVQLVDYFCGYRGKKISTRTWMSETEKLVERLAALDGKDVQTRLFKVQLLLTQERYKEAQWELDRIQEEVDFEQYGTEIGCYYLYLTTLLSEDEEYIDRITARITRCYQAQPGNWRIAWLMLHLSEEYVKSFSGRWLLLEEQFKYNCVSPILYVEAWRLLEMNPTLLMKLGPFEMQVLNFAAKKELLSQDIIVQIRFQMQKIKEYSKQAFCILKECYEKYPDNETLQAICALLIKGNKTESAYFEWYSMGVEQELRITKLYEYYMMSLPENYEGEIPRIVLMYFVYQSDLDYKKNAFLYSYVYKRRETQPEYYIKFCARIENFVLTQMQRGRINKDLAYLYRHILTPALLNEERATTLLPLLFTHCIQTKQKDIHEVVVRYAIDRLEYRYPMTDGTAYVPLYGDDYKLFLEDGRGCRYTVSIPYEQERMMEPGQLITEVSAYVKEHDGLDIYLCESNRSFLDISEENVYRFRHIADSAHMEVARKNEICLKLLHYYYEKDYMHKLDEYLLQLEPEEKQEKERNEILRFLVIRGMYDKAFTWMKRFSVQGVDSKTLMRLCSRLIARDGLIEDKELTKMIAYAFEKGKYDGNLLSYLVCFYQGTMKKLRDIWKAAEAFDVDTYEMSERILVQMLFTGSFIGERMEIFKKYISGGAKMEVETAFLFRCSYDYFVKEQLIDSFVFTDMIRVYERGEALEKVCRLAFLKYYASHKEGRTQRIKDTISCFLSDLEKEDICFAFYKEYVGDFHEMARFADKAIVEYKTQPGSCVTMHYVIEKGRYTESGYRQVQMREMYDGVYVKSFVLFFGEKLQYYIVENKDGKEQVTESASVGCSDSMQEENDSMYTLINDIVAGQALQDYDTVDHLLEDYYQKEYVVSQIFHLK